MKFQTEEIRFSIALFYAVKRDFVNQNLTYSQFFPGRIPTFPDFLIDKFRTRHKLDASMANAFQLIFLI